MHLSWADGASIGVMLGITFAVIAFSEIYAPHVYPRLRIWGYFGVLDTINIAAVLKVLHSPVYELLSLLVIVAFVITMRGGPPGRKQRSGVTRLKIKQFLARGVSARRPVPDA